MGLALTIALVSFAVAAIAAAFAARAVSLRRRQQEGVTRLRSVAETFDINPSDADLLADVAVLGGPKDPSRVATDRRAFDAGAARYLTRSLLEGGDVWSTLVSLAHLRKRLGYPEPAQNAPGAEFLGRVNVCALGTSEGVPGIVVDRRGVLRVVVPSLPKLGTTPGDAIDLSPLGKPEERRTLRLSSIDGYGTGAVLDLVPLEAPAPSPRVPTLLKAQVRRSSGEPPFAEDSEALLLDLSASGACLRLAFPPGVGDSLEISFSLDPSARVEAIGRVVWSNLAGKSHWRAGVRFESIEEPSRRQILAFLATQDLSSARGSSRARS